MLRNLLQSSSTTTENRNNTNFRETNSTWIRTYANNLINNDFNHNFIANETINNTSFFFSSNQDNLLNRNSRYILNLIDRRLTRFSSFNNLILNRLQILENWVNQRIEAQNELIDLYGTNINNLITDFEENRINLINSFNQYNQHNDMLLNRHMNQVLSTQSIVFIITTCCIVLVLKYKFKSIDNTVQNLPKIPNNLSGETFLEKIITISGTLFVFEFLKKLFFKR